LRIGKILAGRLPHSSDAAPECVVTNPDADNIVVFRSAPPAWRLSSIPLPFVSTSWPWALARTAPSSGLPLLSD